jgi:hypothetical protein
MQQAPAPAYLLALVALRADEVLLARLAEDVARDVAGVHQPSADDIAAARASVDWLLTSLRAGPVPDEAALRILRDRAAGAARAGGEMRLVLDRALSAGWVLWAAVNGRPELTPAAARALGEALLRTGDAAAAAIADAHADAERELATRSASALRELLDELLELADGDEAGRTRLVRRAAEMAIDPDRPLDVVVVDAGLDLEDGDPVVAEIARRLGRGAAPSIGDPRGLGGPQPGPVVAATRGRLVILVPQSRRAPDIADALDALGTTWAAATAEAPGLLGSAAAMRESTAALAVALRLGRRGAIIPATSLALERALLAAPELLRAGVDRELGPLLSAPRAAGLVETIEAYLAERENVRAAARRLGVAPRTVAYRLERMERILGGKLDADRRLRLATALFARRLLAPPPVSER